MRKFVGPAILLATLVILLLLPLATISAAPLVWVGPNCTVGWDHPTPDVVQGYRVYLDGSPVVDTTEQTTNCAAMGVTVGQHEAYVTAYNPAGGSGASNTVPFVFIDAAPAAPTGVALSP